MALANGDYINLQSDIKTTIEADTGLGGLFETDAPPVRLVETKARNEAKDYMKNEIPVIVPFVTGDTEAHSDNLNSEVKVFHVSFNVMTRGADRTETIAECKKIVSRLKWLIRMQTKTENHWNDASNPSKIDGGQGTLISQINSTSSYELLDDEEYGAEGEFSFLMVIDADIVVPVQYDYLG